MKIDPHLNLWEPWPRPGKCWRTVTTNGAYRTDGRAVMGRGCALQAARRYGDLAWKLGARLKCGGGNVPTLFSEYQIITFPVKHHWSEKADLELIEESCGLFAELIDSLDAETIRLPRPGCGNGDRSWDREVREIVEMYLGDIEELVVVGR